MKIEIYGNGNGEHLIAMLAWIELLGNIGHSASFKVNADGDGSCRWAFKFEDGEMQKKYDALRREFLKEYTKNHKDIERFDI